MRLLRLQLIGACMIFHAVILHEGAACVDSVFVVKSGTFVAKRHLKSSSQPSTSLTHRPLRPPSATRASSSASRPQSRISQHQQAHHSMQHHVAFADEALQTQRPSTAASFGSRPFSRQSAGSFPKLNATFSTHGTATITERHDAVASAVVPEAAMPVDVGDDTSPDPLTTQEHRSISVETGKLLTNSMFGNDATAADTVVAESFGCELFVLQKPCLLWMQALRSPDHADDNVFTVDREFLQQSAASRLQRLTQQQLRDTDAASRTGRPKSAASSVSRLTDSSVYHRPSTAVSRASRRKVNANSVDDDDDEADEDASELFARPLSRAGRSPRTIAAYHPPHVDLAAIDALFPDNGLKGIESAALALLDAGMVNFTPSDSSANIPVTPIVSAGKTFSSLHGRPVSASSSNAVRRPSRPVASTAASTSVGRVFSKRASWQRPHTNKREVGLNVKIENAPPAHSGHPSVVWQAPNTPAPPFKPAHTARSITASGFNWKRMKQATAPAFLVNRRTASQQQPSQPSGGVFLTQSVRF